MPCKYEYSKANIHIKLQLHNLMDRYSLGIGELICFGMLILLFYYEIACSYKAAPSIPNLTGEKLRISFLLLLLISVTLRFISIPTHVLLAIEDKTESELFYSKIDILFREIPSWFYLVAYTKPIIFWLTIIRSSCGKRVDALYFWGIFLNILPISVFFVTATTTLIRQDALHVFLMVSMFLVGSSYLLVGFFWIYSTRQIVQILKARSASYYPGPREYATANSLTLKFNILGTICPIAFCFKGFYNLASMVIWERYYPENMAHYVWDTVMYLSTEFIPCTCILLVFWNGNKSVRKNEAISPPILYYSLDDHGYNVYSPYWSDNHLDYVYPEIGGGSSQ